MTLYRYRAVTRAGEIVTGEQEGESEAAILGWLKARDLVPLQAAKARPARPKAAGGRLGAARRAVLTRKLAILLGAGLKLDQSLQLLIRAASRPSEASLLGRILARVQGGSALADSLRAEGNVFAPDYLAVIRAGEAGGNLAPSLARLADSLERSRRMREAMRAKLTYPAILVVAAIASVAILLTLVVPAFEPLFAEAGKELPAPTRALVAAASALRVGGPLFIAAVALLVLSLRRLDRRHPLRRAADRALLSLPVAGPILVHLDAARFCRTLGALTANGVQLLTALSLARATVANAVLGDGVEALIEGVKRGERLHSLLRGGRYWPELMPELCQVGEETGQLDEMMVRLGDILDEETTRALEGLVALATPVITLLLALLVSGVLAGLLATILSVNELAV